MFLILRTYVKMTIRLPPIPRNSPRPQARSSAQQRPILIVALVRAGFSHEAIARAYPSDRRAIAERG